VRYLDSAVREEGQTLHGWFREHLKVDARYFGAQTGYFSVDGFYPFEGTLERMLRAGGEVRLVLGANQGALRAEAVERVLRVLSPFAGRASLTLVGMSDAVFHPKTFFLEKADGEEVALVGSANWTRGGLATNVEGAIALDSRDDPGEVRKIRAAIDRWHLEPHRTARQVTRESISRLVSDGWLSIASPAPPPGLPGSTGRGGQVVGTALGPIIDLPRPPVRIVVPSGVVPRKQGLPPLPVPPITGATGIVKVLSRLDTKGFRDERGTLYIALPVELMPLFEMHPSGKNREPRQDVELEARLDSVPGVVVTSAGSPTNVTAVGFGHPRRSHKDLRLNYLKKVALGIRHLASVASIRVPREGDWLAIELPIGLLPLRMTFLTTREGQAALRPDLDGRKWAWLSPGRLPPWPE